MNSLSANKRSKKTAFAHLLAAALTTFVLASISHSQSVLNQLMSIGISIDPGTRLSATVDDLFGLLPGYGTVILLGLLIGFSLIKFLLNKLAKLSNPAWYWWALAGGLTMFSALLLMQPILNITLIAGARSVSGFAMQCLAGVAGGAVYGLLRNQRSSNNRSTEGEQ